MQIVTNRDRHITLIASESQMEAVNFSKLNNGWKFHEITSINDAGTIYNLPRPLYIFLVNEREKKTMTDDKIAHPKHYQGSCAESWDLSVLEWGAEYAIAAWVIQAQQYYDRHKDKNGIEDLKKALEFLDHAVKIFDWAYDESNERFAMFEGFWMKEKFLRDLIKEAMEEEGTEVI